MKLIVFTADGASSTEKDFPHFPEFEGTKGTAALRQVVLAQQANKRQGNASTKTRAENVDRFFIDFYCFGPPERRPKK